MESGWGCKAGLVVHKGITLMCGPLTPCKINVLHLWQCATFSKRCQRGECKWEDIYGTELPAAARGQKWWWSGLHLQSGPCGTRTDAAAGHWSTGGPLWVHTLAYAHTQHTHTWSVHKDRSREKKYMKEEVTKDAFTAVSCQRKCNNLSSMKNSMCCAWITTMFLWCYILSKAVTGWHLK